MLVGVLSQALGAKRSTKPVIETKGSGVGMGVVGREVGKGVVGRGVVGALVFMTMTRGVGAAVGARVGLEGKGVGARDGNLVGEKEVGLSEEGERVEGDIVDI